MNYAPVPEKTKLHLHYTELDIPDSACEVVLPAGTVVYIPFGQKYSALVADQRVSIEARGSTNYDNQRKAGDPDKLQGPANFLFYIKGKFGLPGRKPAVEQSVDERVKDLKKVLEGKI